MTTRRSFTLAALALGAAAPFAGNPFPSRTGTVDVGELAGQIDRGDDHIEAVDLAEWIRDQRPSLRIFDLRTKEQFDDDHIPTAEFATIQDLAAARLGADDTVVLYSEGGAHAAQAWVLLRALGHQHVVFLRSGMYEWQDQVLSPTLAVDATEPERQAFERSAAVSHYFGGMPSRGVARAHQEASACQRRRRGC